MKSSTQTSGTPVRVVLASCAAVAVATMSLLGLDVEWVTRLGSPAPSAPLYIVSLIIGFVAAGALFILSPERPASRRSAGVLIALLGGVAVVDYGRLAAPIVTASDLAVGELYTSLAADGRLLLGPYSRFGWHHPGPLFFYISAPFYMAAGHRAPVLYAVALTINLASVVTVVFALGRGPRWPWALTMALACIGFAWRAPWLLGSPWTGHIPVLPSLAFLALSAAVAAERTALLPLMVAWASFVAQTHVGLAPTIALVTAIVLLAAGQDGRVRTPAFHGYASLAAAVAIALWLVPIREAASHAGGNVAALWEFFVTRGDTWHAPGEAIAYWSHGLTWVLRPDFELTWGGHVVLASAWWVVPLGVLQLPILGLTAWIDLRAGRRAEAWFAGLLLLASTIALWGLTRVQGDILGHDLFRIAALGALNVAVIGAAGIRPLLGPAAQRLSSPRVAQAVHLAAFAVIAAVGVRDLGGMTGFERRRTERAAIVRTHAAVRDHLRAGGVTAVLIAIDGDAWGEAAGVMLRLRQDGFHVAVEESQIPMFTPALAQTGTEELALTFSGRGARTKIADIPGAVALGGSGAWSVHAARIARGG